MVKKTTKKKAVKTSKTRKKKSNTKRVVKKKPTTKRTVKTPRGGEKKTTKAQIKEKSTSEEEVQSTEKSEESKDEGEKEETIGAIMEDEGLVTEPDRESMLNAKDDGKLAEVVMKIDRLDGKLELFKGMIDAFNERLLDLNERLGDTRRLVFEREKQSSKLESEFEKVSGIVKELDPEKIVLRFEKFKTEISKQDAKVERVDELLVNLSDRTRVMEDKLSKIKSIENIVNASEIVEKKIKGIDDTQKYADKTAAKVEAMFLEVNDKVNYMKKNVEKIDKNDNILQDVMKDLDKVKFEIDEDLVKKKQIDTLLNSVKDIIVEEVVGINPAAFDNLRRKVAIMENKNKTNKQLENERKKLGILEDQIERDYQMGRIKKKSYNELKKSVEKKLDEIEMVFELRHGGSSQKSEKTGKLSIDGSEEKEIKEKKERKPKKKEKDRPLKEKLLNKLKK